MSDIFGKVLGTMLAFILLFFAPFTMVTLSNEMVARRTIMNEMQSFIDEVIDTRAVTDKQLEDLYLGISGLGPICDVEVNRYVRVVDPDPINQGKIYTTYVYSENNKEYNQGDKVQLRVHAIGDTSAARILRPIIGAWIDPIDYTFTARVR